MAKELIVNVVELLRRAGTTKDVDVNVASADLEFDDSRVIDEPVHVRMHLDSLPTGISVTGEASATWAGECRRCLAPLQQRVTVDIAELYQQTQTDPDAYEIENDQINLLPMVRENLLLSIPVGPLCREDCPGFCPHCGADLSQGSCNCQPVAKDDRWAALEALRDKLPE